MGKRWRSFIEPNIPGEADLRGGRCALWEVGGGVWVVKEVLLNGQFGAGGGPSPQIVLVSFRKGLAVRGKNDYPLSSPSLATP